MFPLKHFKHKILTTMKSFKLNITLLLIALMAVATTSCDLTEVRDRTIDTSDPQVEFFPLSRTVSGTGATNINVQLIGEQRDSDLNLTVSVSGESTAVEGTHYTLPTNSVTIASETSVATFTVNYSGTGTPVELILELNGTDEVRAAPNLRTHTLTIQ